MAVRDRWWLADPHFGHEKTCTEFKRADGSPLRPFKDATELNEVMIERWNARVKPHDKVYLLGDVVINRRFLPILDQLVGIKVLVKGNHDIFKLKDYLPYFDDVHGALVFDNLIATHVPIHPDSVGRFRANVHGHLHSNVVLLDGQPDPRYLCVSVEHTDYAPLHHDEVLSRLREQAEWTTP